MAVVNGFLEEPAPGHIAHSRLSGLLLRDDNFLNWARWMLNYSIPTAYKLADATEKWGETDAKNETAFQLAMGTTDPFFDYLRKDATLTKVFSDYMRNVTASWPWSLQHAVDGFDWASLPAGAKVVDVGGSHGQLAVKVASKHPHLKFLIQDLPETIETAQKTFEADQSIDSAIKSRVQFMGHDFFKPQTVTDAHVYFLRMIIHDWPDRDALVILNQLRVALEKNPSARIVLMDTVLPPPGTVSVLQEQQLRVRDLMMMQVFNARERELEDFKELAERAGLKISHVEQPLDSCMGLLTVQLADSASSAPPEQETGSTIPARKDSPLSRPIDIDSNEDPVLIMGAGISGLCLAQALKKAGIPFLVFERDPAIDHRPQGYRLKLEKDGAQALQDCLPENIFHTFKTSCAVTRVGETDFNAISGQIVKSRQGGGLSGDLGLFPSFTVDRTAFRESLMTGIHDRIAFGKELVSYSIVNEKGVSATFKDGSILRGRFIVGADGLHSAVRRQHLQKQGKLVDTGAVCIYGKTPLTPEVKDRFPEKGRRWMTIVSDTAPMLQSALIGEAPVTMLVETIRFTEESRALHSNLPSDYLYWALIGPKARFGSSLPCEGAKNYAEAAHEAARLTLDISTEWHPSLRSLFELQETRQATCLRVASSIPDIPEWEPSDFVTLLGDAVHPMSPCGGVGANTGLCDAASLAKLLKVSGGRPRAERVGAFELEMRSRAKRSIFRSEAGGKLMFGQKNLVDCEPCSWLS